MHLSFRPFYLLFSAVLLIATPVRADTTSLKIAVRSEVDRPFEGWGKAPRQSHGKVYYLLSIKEGKPGSGVARELIKPVDEAMLRKVLVDQLGKHGYREMAKDEKPDILLTVMYGRAFLENPYMDGMVVDAYGVVHVAGAANEQITNSRSTIYQEKLQMARLEKLFIRVTGWAYPEQNGKKSKPKELWKTTVLIDEPARRDLNQFLGKMLAAAADYFDQPVEDKEAFISTDLPEGYVRIGESSTLPDQQDDRKP